ncbi:PREDICTED: quinone oxidoreductase-like protein 2 isoform X2 [Ceratotherium simum simum]|uniref:Quinone oxidoreductase-like protein 2 isoform X2 n=1 Tax=Ceratotherium simum simum TaxID=73337 RepID=A0ABM1CH47_CERSS|nr:PREDICTED: quinone oxidoreductase-like protein 2 isoform X2 [Ceratotherium simum simum]
MAAVVWARCFSRAWLRRRAGLGCGRHYRAALCAELKQPLAIEEVAPRPVQPHEVRVDVHFCGVNFADILACCGQYQEKPHLPFTPGFEFSGTVLETGRDVSTVKEGDRVIGVSTFNGMAEECVIDQKRLWQIPESVPLREAATLPISYGTAILALEHRACTQPGETVLVTAAAGATGLAVIDVATNVLQAKVIAAAGSDEKCKLAMQRGAQSSVNYSQGSLKEAVEKLLGMGGQDCSGGFCWRHHCFCACQPSAPEECVCHGGVLGPIPRPELSPLLRDPFLGCSVLPATAHPATHWSSFQAGGGQ